jgi:hypothetical protein
MPENNPDPQFSRPHSGALRLTFAYEGDRITLIGKQRVDMIVPPSDAVRDGAGFTGVWLDLNDAQGRTLFRRALHRPIREDVEVFSPGPGQNINRIPTEAPKGVFVAVVPDAEQGDHVALTRASPVQGAARSSVKELARFSLKE